MMKISPLRGLIGLFNWRVSALSLRSTTMVRLIFMVAAITSLLSWGVLGFVDLYIVAAMSLASLVIAGGVGYIMSSNRGTIYGIFYETGKAGFSIANLKPTEGVKLTAEDKSYAVQEVINAGGVPVDCIGVWFCTHGMMRFGLSFDIKPGPMRPEYIAMRKQEKDEHGENGLVKGVKDAQAQIPDKEDKD